VGAAVAALRALVSRIRTQLLLALYLFVCAAYFVPGASWNPVSRFALTRAIVERQSFEITRFAASTGDRAQVGERYYSDKAPVPSMLAVPAYAVFYAVARARNKLPAFEARGTPERPAERVRVSPAFRSGLHVCSLSTAGVAGALLGVALFELLRRRVTERAALFGAIATVLGTPLFVYATSFFGHTIAAAFLLGALALVATSRRAARARLIGAGACLALAAGSEYVVAVPALLMAGFFVWQAPRERRPRVIGWLVVGAAAPLALIAFYHQVCFGAPWRTGYAFVTRPIFAQGHAQGFLGVTYPKLEAVVGLLFGRARGLFYVAPISAVGALALALAWYRHRSREAALACVVFLALLWINASYYMWHGGWATGPRHLVPAIAFVGIGIGFSFEWPRWRVVATIAAAASAWLMVMTVAVALEAPPKADAIFEHLLPALGAGKIARTSGASNVGLLLGIAGRWSLMPIVLFIAGGAWWLMARRPHPGEPAMSPKSERLS
jgi:hypothetical protein